MKGRSIHRLLFPFAPVPIAAAAPAQEAATVDEIG